MFISRFVKLALAAATLLGQPVFAGPRCTPAVRREWRSLTPSERADWIDAVKVKNIRFHVVAKLTLPHPVSQQITS